MTTTYRRAVLIPAILVCIQGALAASQDENELLVQEVKTLFDRAYRLSQSKARDAAYFTDYRAILDKIATPEHLKLIVEKLNADDLKHLERLEYQVKISVSSLINFMSMQGPVKKIEVLGQSAEIKELIRKKYFKQSAVIRTVRLSLKDRTFELNLMRVNGVWMYMPVFYELVANRDIVAAFDLERPGRFSTKYLVEWQNRVEKLGEAIPVDLATLPAVTAPVSSKQAEQLQKDLASKLKIPRLLKDKWGIEFSLIPPGSFEMGKPVDGRGMIARHSKPHHVTITRPFYISKYELTQAQWRRIVGRGSKQHGVPVEWQGDNRPQIFDRFNTVRALLFRMNSQSKYLYRLPTEAEWEYSAKAGSDNAFWWGDEPDFKLMDGALNKEYDRERFFRGPSDVQKYRANVWGLSGMHGGVKEICSDLFSHLYYENSPKVDPLGPTLKSLKQTSHHYNISVSIRGGNYMSAPEYCTATRRGLGKIDASLKSVGLRVVIEIPIKTAK